MGNNIHKPLWPIQRSLEGLLVLIHAMHGHLSLSQTNQSCTCSWKFVWGQKNPNSSVWAEGERGKSIPDSSCCYKSFRRKNTKGISRDFPPDEGI